MITIENSDGILWNIEYHAVDMIKEYQSTGKIDINLNKEGPCCETIGLYRLLDHICEQWSINKRDVSITTWNQWERHDQYLIRVQSNHWQRQADRSFPPQIDTPNNHIGLFVGRSTWVRLWLAGWLNKHYADSTLLTNHYDRNSEYHKAHLGLDNMLKEGATLSDIGNSKELIEKSPIELIGNLLPPGQIDLYDILQVYDQFFAELVCETYISGNTFFPTEKTYRPIMSMKPFILHASPGTLQEHKKQGYQTFDRWWSEEYDDYGEQLRIEKIQEVIKDIMSWDQARIRSTLQEMQPILEHNRNLYFAK